jgi:hypothetical protein
MEAPGRLAPDGIAYFVQGDYLVAVDSAGSELPGWPRPLGFRADDRTRIDLGPDGTAYAWSGGTLAAFPAHGSRPGWTFDGDVANVVPVPQGVFVESTTSGSAACGDERSTMTLLGSGGEVQSTWTLQGKILAVGPDGTIYAGQGDSILAYDGGGAIKPGWPVNGWTDLTLDSSGRVYLWWWKFREMPAISMNGPGNALETRIVAVDSNGHASPGWPITIEGAASEPAFGPDGSVYVTREVYTSGVPGGLRDTVMGFDANGKSKAGWPVSMPAGYWILRSGAGGAAPSPDPPQIGPDGTVYLVAADMSQCCAGVVEAFDPSGRTRSGWPYTLADWQTMSNLFTSDHGSGFFAVGRTGLVFMSDGYSILAVGLDGKLASGWPVKAPSNTIAPIMGLDCENDGGLLVQWLNGTLGEGAPLAFAAGAKHAADVPVGALAPNFPGTLTVVRYLPSGSVAP